MFPQVDPIPLPAPVWLFRVLELLTVALHFFAVQLLIGGLLIASIWAILGRWRRRDPMIDASGTVAARLPIVTTFVINLGVPPLLFAQVLYGRALYTSSILIGVYWIAVILLLAVAYTLLYLVVTRAQHGKAWGWIGLLALLVVAKIAFIYSSNMTLMLRPEAWPRMYRADPLGWHLNGGDPTVLPRWLFMLAGGLTVGGVGMMLLGMKRRLQAPTTGTLRYWGARLTALGVVLQAAAGYWVVATQPAGVRAALLEGRLYAGCLVVWGAVAAALVATALVAQVLSGRRSWLLSAGSGTLAFLLVAATVVFRGGIRDATLLAQGFDVWQRQIVVNWVVVSLFLALFAIALPVLFWLGTVVARARGVDESYV